MNEPKPESATPPEETPNTEHPSPTPEIATYTLRWTCPRCHRPWIAAAAVAAGDRRHQRTLLRQNPQLLCGRCGAAWAPMEVGIDWQPENRAAAAAVDQRQETLPP